MSEPVKEVVDAATTPPGLLGIGTYIWIVWLAMWGGITRFLRARLDQERPIDWRNPRFWVELAIEMLTSAFVGIVSFYICKACELNELWTVAVVAVAGHEGGRAINLIISTIQKRGSL